MTGQSPDIELQSIWKEQDMTTATPTLSDVNGRIHRFDRRIRRRNFLEYMAGGVGGGLLAALGIGTVWQAHTLARFVEGAGYFALAMAAFFVAVQIFLRSDAAGMPDPAQNGVSFHLARLRRERNLLASVGRWYLLPMVPGFLMIYGAGLAGPNWPFSLVAAAITVAFLGWVLHINLKAARCIDSEIAEIEQG